MINAIFVTNGHTLLVLALLMGRQIELPLLNSFESIIPGSTLIQYTVFAFLPRTKLNF